MKGGREEEERKLALLPRSYSNGYIYVHQYTTYDTICYTYTASRGNISCWIPFGQSAGTAEHSGSIIAIAAYTWSSVNLFDTKYIRVLYTADQNEKRTSRGHFMKLLISCFRWAIDQRHLHVVEVQSSFVAAM